MTEKEDQTEDVGGIYETEDGKLLFVDTKGDMFKFDFDVNKNLNKNNEHAIKNNIEMDTMDDEEHTSEDLTKEQYREHYWHETEETKLDGSTAMMEARYSKCIEAGGDPEECREKVKAEMKRKGSENTNTEDISEEEKEEAEEKNEEKTEEKTDTVEICPKKLDMLLKKEKEFDELKEKYDELQEKNETMKADMDEFKDKVDVIFKERETELETKRQKKIKKLSTDFDIPIERIENKTMEELQEHEDILSLAIKPNKEETEETVDFEQNKDDMEAIYKKMVEEYKH